MQTNEVNKLQVPLLQKNNNAQAYPKNGNKTFAVCTRINTILFVVRIYLSTTVIPHNVYLINEINLLVIKYINIYKNVAKKLNLVLGM